VETNSYLHLWLARTRAEDLRRVARHAPATPDLPAEPVTIPLTLRFAFPDDADAVARLAALDSSDPPPAPLLLAEVGGEPQAALSLANGRVIADPFRSTPALVELLRARARQLSPGSPSRRLRWPRVGLVRWRSAWR
jgi:hypothetical protein